MRLGQAITFDRSLVASLRFLTPHPSISPRRYLLVSKPSILDDLQQQAKSEDEEVKRLMQQGGRMERERKEVDGEMRELLKSSPALQKKMSARVAAR